MSCDCETDLEPCDVVQMFVNDVRIVRMNFRRFENETVVSVAIQPSCTPAGLTFGTATVVSGKVEFTVDPSVANVSYIVSCTVTMASGNIIEGRFPLEVS